MSRSEHWRRDQPQFFNFLALERTPQPGAPDAFGGLPASIVSADANSGSTTYLVELPVGWRHQADALLASLEFFVLRGDVSADEVKIGPGGYIHLPQGGGGAELRSAAGALAIAFWEPNIPAYPPPYTQNRTARFRDVPYQTMPRDRESHGLLHKSLRLPDPTGTGGEGGPGGMVRLMYLPPGEISPFEHNHHECWEELLLLQGDILIVDEGMHGVGSMNGHPQEWWHGPYVSRFGALALVHTDAPMGHPWGRREMPFQDDIVNAYLDEAPWGVNVEHTPWAETPWTRFQELPEFREWATNGEGAAEWGDKVGRGSVSAFRSQWQRTVGPSCLGGGDHGPAGHEGHEGVRVKK